MADELFPSDDKIPRLDLDEPTHDMDDSIIYLESKSVAPDRRYKSGMTWLAWIVIIGCVALLATFVFIVQFGDVPRSFQKAELVQPILLGKGFLGFKNLGMARATEFESAFERTLNTGPFQVRYCYSIMLNELSGAPDALEHLRETGRRAQKVGAEPDEKQQRLARVLTELFEDYDRKDWKGTSVDAADRLFLKQELVWFGQLALAPGQLPDSKERIEIIQNSTVMASVALGLFSLLGLLLLMGLAGIVTLLILFFNEALTSRVYDQSMYGPIYAETFALWMVLFIFGNLIGALPGIRELNLAGLPLVLTMFALAWPTLRGIPFSHLREDIGLTFRNPIAEVFAGVTAYISLIPILAICIVCLASVLGIINAFAPPQESFESQNAGSHPIADELFGESRWASLARIFVLTVIVAPIVEETFFRGVLFRHLRDATGRMARWPSVLFAATISSFIFASIHPQGIIGIPILMPLAFGFSLVRQWRGSLIAPMTMHAIHNSLATIAMSLVLI